MNEDFINTLEYFIYIARNLSRVCIILEYKISLSFADFFLARFLSKKKNNKCNKTPAQS